MRASIRPSTVNACRTQTGPIVRVGFLRWMPRAALSSNVPEGVPKPGVRIRPARGSGYLRQGLIDDRWWWLHIAQGVVVLVLMVAVALDPTRPGSWWSRHRGGGRQPGEASSSSALS
jgi:hypothetical protein